MRKHKKGPEPKPERELRKHNVMVRFNDAEYAKLKKICGMVPLGSYLRYMVLTDKREHFHGC